MNRKINEIVQLLRDLPGISLKQAERLSINLIENPEYTSNLNKIISLSLEMKKDELTGLIINKEEIANKNKEKDTLLIIESNKDVNNIIQKTNTTKSIFVLDIKNKRDFKSTKVVLERLFKTIKKYNTEEVLFLLTPSIENELIIRVIKEEINNFGFEKIPKLTRLSMGIPFGGSLEFSDERTIREAINKREKA